MQVEHKTERGTVLFVKAPVFFQSFSIKKLWCNFLRFDFNNSYQDIVIENGNWQLIGLTSEVTEEQSKMMVDHEHGVGYKIYEGDLCIGYVSALDSFKSLMQKLQVYEVNPYGEVCFDINKNYPDVEIRQKMADRWLEAQSRTGRWIVLFKTK